MMRPIFPRCWFPLDRAKFVSAKLSRNRSGFKLQKNDSVSLMPWRLQVRSNFFSVSVCVCPLFLWEIVNLSLLDIYSWRNRRRRASIVSQWFLVLPCHVSTDWSSAVECPKMPKVNACRAKTQLMICYKFISKDLLNRLKKSGVDSVDSFRCHWIQSFERRCLGSLMKPCTESGSSGSTGDMSQMNIHESESNFAGHLRPPWMMKWWTHMNAYERFVFTFPDEHSQKFWGP